jgi:hypothetical protein
MAADEERGFLSRWSRRKQDVREGKAVAREPVEDPPVPAGAPAALAPPEPPEPPEPTPPPPTLEDVKSLTFESDFRRFVAQDVDPQVKNAAMKKLFADPRFNVRDPMDVYADDYSIADPIPDDTLRKLASAQLLKLFEETSDDAAPQTVAQCKPHADDADLRLQQDDAPPAESAGDGAGPGPAAAHDAVPPGSGELPESDPG